MGFPRAPHKKVAGTLKLQVAAPVSSEAPEPEPEVPSSPDFSAKVSIKPPRGFLMETKLSDVIARQEAGAIARLAALASKARGCCHSSIDPVAVENAREVVVRACGALKHHATQQTSIVVGNKKDGAISIDLVHGERRLAVVVTRGSTSCGRYLKEVLVGEDSDRRPVPLIDAEVNWLAG